MNKDVKRYNAGWRRWARDIVWVSNGETDVQEPVWVKKSARKYAGGKNQGGCKDGLWRVHHRYVDVLMKHHKSKKGA